MMFFCLFVEYVLNVNASRYLSVILRAQQLNWRAFYQMHDSNDGLSNLMGGKVCLETKSSSDLRQQAVWRRSLCAPFEIASFFIPNLHFSF